MASPKSINVTTPLIATATISNYSGGATLSATGLAVDMGQFEQARYVILAGTLDASATVDFLVAQAKTRTGSTASITNGTVSITQIAGGNVASASQMIGLTINANQLDVNNGYHWLVPQVKITVANTNANYIGILAEGNDVKTSPQTTTANQTIG